VCVFVYADLGSLTPHTYGHRAGPRHVGAAGRLVIRLPFKLIFLKKLFNIYLVGAGETCFFINIYIWPVM
jgi:hypothetical protein